MQDEIQLSVEEKISGTCEQARTAKGVGTLADFPKSSWASAEIEEKVARHKNQGIARHH